jgi:hypothetical protein
MTIDELLRQISQGNVNPEYIRRADVARPMNVDEDTMGADIRQSTALQNLMNLITPIQNRGFATRLPINQMDLSGFIFPSEGNMYANVRAGLPMNVNDYRINPSASVEFNKGDGYDESRLSNLDVTVSSPTKDIFRVGYDPTKGTKTLGYTKPFQGGAAGVNLIDDPERRRSLNFFLQRLF